MLRGKNPAHAPEPHRARALHPGVSFSSSMLRLSTTPLPGSRAPTTPLLGLWLPELPEHPAVLYGAGDTVVLEVLGGGDGSGDGAQRSWANARCVAQ